MEPATTTQLITIGGTLGGVMLTLGANAFFERGRARDARKLEELRVTSDHAKWLRDERLSAYAALSTAGEETLHFIRNELPPLVGASDPDRVSGAESRWRALRTELRKAYNRVSLVGTADAIAAGLDLWRTSRNGANDFLRELGDSDEADLRVEVTSLVSTLGTKGDHFMAICRGELQS